MNRTMIDAAYIINRKIHDDEVVAGEDFITLLKEIAKTIKKGLDSIDEEDGSAIDLMTNNANMYYKYDNIENYKDFNVGACWALLNLLEAWRNI